MKTHHLTEPAVKFNITKCCHNTDNTFSWHNPRVNATKTCSVRRM